MTNQNESQKLMLRESVAHKRMDDEFKEATKAVDALYAELDDLRAYKTLAIELANRKGCDSLAGVFDDWEKRELEQQAKGVEDLLDAEISICRIQGNKRSVIFAQDAGAYARKLRKQAEDL